MDKKSMSAVEEVIEFAKAKLEESKQNVGETLEDESKRMEEVINFAKSKLDEAAEDSKAQLNDIIKYSESKLEELRQEAEKTKNKVEDQVGESGIGDTITSAAKSLSGVITNFAKKFGKETSKVSRIISIKSEVGTLTNTRKDKIVELGEACLKIYKLKSYDVVLPYELEHIIDEIQDIESQIENKNAELEKIRKEEDLTPDEMSEIEKEIEKK
ncbi:hypothetical protein [Mahella australiensis]|uniref:Uncharacterized protein n=1 Tax=Mahella australiensis (strain DSM 15567 / CIP 107919 / 50-1 BON) TaxID=697281 RepID=F3ZY73_MAHA5|nr:hypothetical protein [Mahella australiensis]AEE95598.1 hypothetical protein Mahau_0382 [Mahella australiensis 50-1 BON]